MEGYPIPTLGVFVKEVIDPNPGVDRVRVDMKILQIDRKLVNDECKLDVMLRIAMVRELFFRIEDGCLTQIVKVYKVIP
jgi:hypothetical protein